MSAERSHRAAFGKWGQAGVPQKGWSCDSMEDLGEPSAICEMCETQEIRYVHHMSHPRYPSGLAVGCVCAGKMEEDYKNAQNRERDLRNLAKRQQNWSRRTWRQSMRGNYYMNVDGFNLTLTENSRGPKKSWSIRVVNRTTQKEQYSKQKYETLENAKVAAWKALLWAKKNL